MARSAATRPSLPLGSLTQREARSTAACTSCASPRVTSLSMHLTDGTPVDFSSCRVCGAKSWSHDGVELSVTDVIARTRKVS
jgi:hypothetical protein